MKKGVSVMIGYVLLVAIAIIMGFVVYNWIKGYVPKDVFQCPDGVSIFVKEYVYDCIGNSLSLTLKNNGRFSIGGYFIHATNSSLQELATIDLTPYYTGGGSVANGAIIFIIGGENPKKPNDYWIDNFDLTKSPAFPGTIDSIEIIPARYEKEEKKWEFASCGNARLKQKLTCSA